MALAQKEQAPLRGDEKRAYVQAMFTAIAPRYDLLNHLLSLNIDRRWRRSAVRHLDWETHPSGVYLDLCAGTLDLAAELCTQPGFTGTVVGADFVVPMLRLGLGKARGLRVVGADALGLPFRTGHFDGCTVGFGIRNLSDIAAGLSEMARVLRPGARAVILEFSKPQRWPWRALYLFYLERLLPVVGRHVSKHGTAYGYLPRSVLAYPGPDRFTTLMRQAGFRDVGYQRLTFGIVTVHWGTRG
jgi:demethylmenaquinone methyltransferase / 2-methoxy-6-polyprenyl-1,4-benzoquinol methylase